MQKEEFKIPKLPLYLKLGTFKKNKRHIRPYIYSEKYNAKLFMPDTLNKPIIF